ncbi:AraC-like ligand binding domain-containing protein [Pedobacter westerhofensis]|uniref:AraC-like ligand binding domain-containing protein n=1 Tax=Pedobacter westerhofensis TaxID=425512 RepID=A0A521FL51_9SPHI|nr:AraC family transcriptional regulator [Pedobacter westerhofensis]SMO96846.1 AraC-like ligand binding domain-containing protein [Pedobacter westerhofensis]
MFVKEAYARQLDHLKEINDLFDKNVVDPGRTGIKIYDRKDNACRKHLKPNRREFYQIIFFEKGDGQFTLGLDTYQVNGPSIAFIHPNEIISWENTGNDSAGHICLFTRQFIEEHPLLKTVTEKYGLFADVTKSMIRIRDEDTGALADLFMKMHEEEAAFSARSGDVLQAYMQLIMLTSTKYAQDLVPIPASSEYRHVHDFFQSLERSFSKNNNGPVRLRTAQEFADELAVHPNYLNALIKRYTGENLSTHIKRRLLEESKVLLIQTDWTLQNIALALGFTAQPGFSQFFKKNLGATPGDYRKNFSANIHSMAIH